MNTLKSKFAVTLSGLALVVACDLLPGDEGTSTTPQDSGADSVTPGSESSSTTGGESTGDTESSSTSSSSSSDEGPEDCAPEDPAVGDDEAECSLLCQTGCAEGKTCVVAEPFGPATCVPAGEAGPEEPCDPSAGANPATTCQAGLQCFSAGGASTCVEFCGLADPQACGDSGFCIFPANIFELDFDLADQYDVGLCQAFELECDLEDPNTCPEEGSSCYVITAQEEGVDPVQGTSCFPDGTLPLGETCGIEASNLCVPGGLCRLDISQSDPDNGVFVGVCSEICPADGDYTCMNPDEVCTPADAGGFFSLCRPAAQAQSYPEFLRIP